MSTMAEVIREQLAKGMYQMPGDNLPYETVAEHVEDALIAAGFGKLADAEAQAYAKVIARIELGTPYMVNEKYVAGANWVRSQVEDVLIPNGNIFYDTDRRGS